MTAATAVKCPTGCIADHGVCDPGLHHFPAEKVTDAQTGVMLLAEGWVDSDKRTSGVYVSDGDVSPATARQFAAALTRIADQIEAVLQSL